MTSVASLIKNNPKSYLAGILSGDGCLTSPYEKHKFGYLQLKCKDVEMAENFCASVLSEYGLAKPLETDDRGYYHIRVYNGYGRFNDLRSFEPKTCDEIGSWLVGFFDSDGNVVCRVNNRGFHERRLLLLKSDIPLLQRASSYLNVLGIHNSIVGWKNSSSHFGEKPMHAVRVKCSKENFERFIASVGFSIARKMNVLLSIPGSYR